MIQDCREYRSLATPRPTNRSERRICCSLRSLAASCALAPLLVMLLGAAMTTPALAQEMGDMPAMEADMSEAGMPMTESGGGSFFSQDLGTLLRMRYNTESYGQDQRGNLDLGTMQVASFEDAIAFFDGQVTLNDVTGVGYNLGVGFRWLHWAPFPMEPERIMGFSFWTDGTSTDSGNFFPQIGLSYESLGDMWDLRVNGYIPVGQESQIGRFTPTGDIAFSENFLVLESIADRNTSFNVAEAEIARRLMSDRDAWAFVGPYVLGNSEQDAAGYRVGVRGYAYPDLLVQLAVTDDDIFKTNAAFSVTWFVGRTRTSFQPACGLPDRMREPVMRNDYVALAKTTEVGGEALTNTDGEAFRFVHVDSDAPAGGDGTFENPLNDVGTVEGNSVEDDIILLYSDSNFLNQNTLVLQDRQRLLGEGNNEIFTINTLQEGIVDIPETSPGARAGARANIVGTTSSDGAVRLADANEVANFNIDGTGSAGGASGIFSPTAGAGNPNIHDMDFSNVAGTGIQFTPLTRTDPDNPVLMTVAGNVTIDDIEFDNMLGVEIDINSFTATDTTNPNVTLQETIAISDIDSQEGAAAGIRLRNTHDNRTATITNYLNGTVGTAGSGGGALADGVLVFSSTVGNTFEGNVTLTNIDIFANTGYALHFEDIDDAAAVTITNNNGLTYNGLAGMAGGMRFDNFDGTFTGNSSTLSNGTLDGVNVIGETAGMITLNSSVTFDSIDGTTINVGPNVTDDFTGDLTVSGAITNHDTGRLVSIQRMSASGASVTLGGAMTDVANANSEGIFVGNNTDGVVLFSGNLTVDTTGFNGIDLENNTGTDISFAGLVDVTSDGAGAIAFEATGGGTLTVGGNANTLTSNGSSALVINGMEINNAGANFADVNATGGVNGIQLVNNTTGPITIGVLGDDAGEGGTITGQSTQAVVVTNSANVTMHGLLINTTAGQTGVEVTKNTTGTQIVNLNDLDINGGANGIDVIGNGIGTLNMTVNDSTIDDVTARGIRINNIDTGTIAVNRTTIDGDDTTATAEGVEIIGSNATITFDGDTLIQQFDGTDFHVDGDGTATGAITFSGDIVNTTGQSVHVHEINGGSVQFASASLINDDGLGILVEDNTGGSISFLGTNDLDPTAAAVRAVFLDNNTGATMTFAGLNINTVAASTTQGLVAQGGGTLSTTGSNNIINTKDGTGLLLNGMTIGTVDLQSVTVNGTTGPVNAILLQNLTGGQVEIGTTTGAQNSGGVLEATGDAIVITNAQNVAIRDVQILNAGGRGVAVTHDTAATANMDVTIDGINLDASTGNGMEVTAASNANSFIMRLTGTLTDRSELEENVVVSATGSGQFQMRVQNTDINVTGTTDAFATTISGNATNVDMILSDTDFTAVDASAVTITTSGGTGKTFDLLVENGSFVNDSALSPAAEFLSSGNSTYNATIRGNTFDNSNAAVTTSDFTMTATGAQARVRLNLGGDDAAEMNNASGDGVYNLIEDAGADFDVFELTDTFGNLRNNGTVSPQSPAGVANPGAFQDLPTAPVVPVIP